MSIAAFVWRGVRRHTGWVLGAGAVAGLAVAVAHLGDMEAFARLTASARPGWLLVASGLQAGTYFAVASGWRMVLAAAGVPQPLRRLYPIAVGKLFADQVIPTAGLGGNMFVVERLMALGIERGTAVAALLISMTGFYAAYSVCAVTMLALLGMKGLASLWISAFVAIFLIVAVTIPLLPTLIRQRGRRALSPALSRFGIVRNLVLIVGEAPHGLMVDRRLVVRVAVTNGLVFLADAASLMMCFRALGHGVDYSVAFVAVMVASMVTTLGPIPLGLGSFEAGSIGVLALMGVPLEAGLAATLLLRMFTLWLPLAPGFVMMGRALRTQAARA